MQFQGKLYRALNPVFAREPLSGRGAALYGGRLNSKGRPALYTSLSILTAIREANQVGSFQPTTLVAYEANFENLFDGRDEDALGQFGMDAASLADPAWRDLMLRDGIAPTQVFAEQLVEQGHQGLMVRSFAAGTDANDLNVVLWTWGTSAGSSLSVIDDEGRLGQP